MKLRGCLVLIFFQKILSFGPLFCKMKLNTKVFGKKVIILHFEFWPQEKKELKMSLKRLH